MNREIKEIILSLGADVCGIANIECFSDAPQGFSPRDLFEGSKSVIVFGVALPKGLTKVEPRLIYGHFNYCCVEKADDVAFKGAKIIEERFKCSCVPIPSDSPYECWDEETKSGHGLLSMKHAACLAGIGTLGKNTLLINRKFGNLLTVGAILTDLDLPSDELCESLCIEGCTKCLDSCPVHAIHDGIVDQKLCRNHTYGTNKRGFGTTDCNICRVVCPMKYGRDKMN